MSNPKYRVTNLNQTVFFAYTYKELSEYFKKTHPDLIGFGLRSLKNGLKNGLMIKKGFIVEKISDSSKRLSSKKFRNIRKKSISKGLFKIESVKYKNKIILNELNMYEMIKQINDKIRKTGKENIKKNKISIILKTLRGGTMSTIFTDYNNVIDLLEKLITDHLYIYDEDGISIKSFDIQYMEVPDPFDNIVFGKKQFKYKHIVNAWKSIRDVTSDMNFSKKSIKLLKEINEKFYLYKPNTYKSCITTSCYISKYRKYNVSKHVEIFYNENKEIIHSPNYLIPKLCKRLKCNIKVYFIDYEIKEKIYKYSEFIEKETNNILIYGGHSYALIKKDGMDYKKDDKIKMLDIDSDFEEMYKQFKMDILKRCEENRKIESIEIKTSKLDDYKICTYDLETCDKTTEKNKKEDTEAYALGFYDGEEYKEIYKNSAEDDILQGFLNWLFDVYTKTNKEIILYAHNGGKFDTYLLIKSILKFKKFVIIGFLEQAGRIINLKLSGKDGRKIIIRDSINLISTSLDKACKDFKPKTKKLTGDVDHDKININNCYSRKIYKYTSGYLKNDCFSLHEILIMFNDIIKSKYGLSIQRVMTNASIARKIFLGKYYDEKTKPLFLLDDETDEELRKYYYGGRNEVMYKLGYTKGKFYYYDFTSLYPYVMWKYVYPYGEMSKINIDKKNRKKFNKKWFGFVKCKFRNKNKNNIPLHGVVSNKKLIFPHCKNWQESILSTEEIRYSLENNIGYEYKFYKVYNYEKKSNFFKKAVEKLYEMKINAQKDGNPALRSIAKIIINSLYGFFGINYRKRDQKIIKKFTDDVSTKNNKKMRTADEKRNGAFAGYLFSQQLKEHNEISGYDIFDIKGRINTKCANVGIASMVTSYARLELYKLLKDIKENGKKIYYMDTDSVITNYNIEKDLKMYNKWIRTGGEKLGELTNETDEKEGYYTELVTLGNKMYALKNDKLKKKPEILKMKGINIKNKYEDKKYDFDKKEIILENIKKLKKKGIDIKNKFEDKKEILENINKLKGRKKVTFDDYKLLAFGFNLKVDNMNFISGVNEMIVKDKGLIKLRNKKNIKSLYDKAEVGIMGYIKPKTI